MNDWTETAERLPNRYCVVFYANAAGDTGPAFYRPKGEYLAHGFRQIHSDIKLENVTHWIEMPPHPAHSEREKT